MAIGKKAIAAVVVVVVIVVAVVGVLALSTPSGNGTVSLYIKDDVGEWKHVNVTFSEIQIHQASGNNSSGWISLSIQNGSIDLASLTNVSQLLASASVQPGKYTQIRFIVQNATGMMTNGTQVNFTVPSGVLKTTHPFNVTAGATMKLTLEVDLQRSIVHNANGWFFTPVIGAVTEG